jgi:hypothetical protein
MESVNEFFYDQNREFYVIGLKKLEHMWAKCINVEGDYIEKVRSLVGFSDYRTYIGPRTFVSILIYYFSSG